MSNANKNRQFILEFYQAISGHKKTEALMYRYTSNSKLVEHLLFFESLFPQYELFIDELTTEDDRVIVRGRQHGQHVGELEGMPPTKKTIKIPFANGYRIRNDEIVEHWFIIDQMELLEQLGLVKMLKQ